MNADKFCNIAEVPPKTMERVTKIAEVPPKIAEDKKWKDTIDFELPEKFDLTYINGENEKVRPVVIHGGYKQTEKNDFTREIFKKYFTRDYQEVFTIKLEVSI